MSKSRADDPLVAEYRAWLRSWGASKRTQQIRTQVAGNRIAAWGPVAGWDAARIQEWLGGENLQSAWSRTTYHSCLTCFCSWAHAAGHSPANPMLGVRRPMSAKSKPRPLSEEEVVRVLAAATPKVRDWIILALYAGLRAHEIAKVRGEDVNDETFHVVGKGGVEAYLPTHPGVWELAQRYPRRGYWWPGKGQQGHVHAETVSTNVGRLFRSLGIEGSIHRCRHVYATRLLRSGVDLRHVQMLMRHATPATTAVYTAVMHDELATAIRRLAS